MKRIHMIFIIFFAVLLSVLFHWGGKTVYASLTKSASVIAPIVVCIYFIFAKRSRKRVMVGESNYIWRCLRKRPVMYLTVCGMTICFVYLLITVFVYSETGATNDEATYIFHAKTFAAWRLTNPVPPIREFFYSYYILTDPAYIAKSFPGYPALLMWGFVIGFPQLIPPLILLASIFATYWALRPVLGRPVSVLAALVVGTTIQGIVEGTHYYSSAAVFLFSPLLFGCVIRYGKNFSWKWAAAAGFFLAANFLARPFDAVGLGLAAVLYILTQMCIRKTWAVKSNLAGICVFMFLGPFLMMGYNKTTVGSFLTGPYTVFFQNYCPESYWIHAPENKQDKPFDTPVAHHHRQYISTSEGYNNYNTHSALAQWFQYRLPLLFFSMAPWGAILAGIPWVFSGRLRKQSLKALVFWPLSHAVYVLYAVGYQLVYSSGITFAVIGLGFFGLTRLRALMRISSGRRQSILLNPALIVGFCFFLVLPAFYVFKVEKFHGYYKQFYQARDALPEGPKIIFARYGADTWMYLELVQNDPVLEQAETIMANDLGARNIELMKCFPEREYYLYDEPSGKLQRIYVQDYM